MPRPDGPDPPDPPAPPPPDGALLRDPATSDVFVIYGGAKFFVPPAQFGPLGFSASNVRLDNDAALDTLPTLPRNNTLLRELSKPEVFVVRVGRKRWIPTAEIFVMLGFAWSRVHTVPDGALASIPSGPPLAGLILDAVLRPGVPPQPVQRAPSGAYALLPAPSVIVRVHLPSLTELQVDIDGTALPRAQSDDIADQRRFADQGLPFYLSRVTAVTAGAFYWEITVVREPSRRMTTIPFQIGIAAGSEKLDLSVGPRSGPAQAAPRPFYVVGHNPNTIQAVKAALDAGANAIEPDVNVYGDRPGDLCISESAGAADAPALVQYLKELRQVALARPELALVVFDCKIAEADQGTELLEAVRTWLVPGTGLYVIISVAHFQDMSLFRWIGAELASREGLMVDEENDPDAVSSLFTKLFITQQCYANGISILHGTLGPHVRPSIERACARRATDGDPKFIYVWTVNDDELQRDYIRIGVDGIISDDLAMLRRVVAEPEFQTVIRLATRADNPFMPLNAAYGLTIHTGDVLLAGTNANVAFTLTGSQGSATVNLDANRPMEQNETTFVTLQSPDLGKLESISVQRDDNGIAPDWFLDTIEVKSFRYGVSARADFNRWIDSTAPFTQAL
jgi:hypothetical protein